MRLPMPFSSDPDKALEKATQDLSSQDRQVIEEMTTELFYLSLNTREELQAPFFHLANAVGHCLPGDVIRKCQEYAMARLYMNNT